jgi:zinc and cadmium transporter
MGCQSGAAFSASHRVGYAVAVGIAAHDFGYGLNKLNLATGGGKPKLLDYLFLLADAQAPLAGGLVAIWWFASARNSMALLAIAAGFFIQMAGSDFLPEVRKANAPRMYAVPYVLCGVGLIYFANLLLGGLR